MTRSWPLWIVSILRLAGWGLGIYAGLCLLAFLAQRRMMYFPDQEPEPEAVQRAVGARLGPWRDGKGSVLGWRRAARLGTPRVLVLHGNAGDALGRADYLRVIEAAGFRLTEARWQRRRGRAHPRLPGRGRQLRKQHLVDLLPDPGFLPFSQRVPTRHAAPAAQLLGKIFPRTTGFQYEENARKCRTIGDSWSASFRLTAFSRQQRFDSFPKRIGQQWLCHNVLLDTLAG